jgi:hypothetical protein
MSAHDAGAIRARLDRDLRGALSMRRSELEPDDYET